LALGFNDHFGELNSMESLDFVEFVMDVDAEFDIEVDEAEVNAWRTLGDVERSILRAEPAAGTRGQVWPRLAALAVKCGVAPERVTRDMPIFLR